MVLSWRDSRHPEGGGAELYLENVMAGLASRGHIVTMLTARYPGAARRSRQEGFLVLRAGGRYTVYLRCLLRRQQPPLPLAPRRSRRPRPFRRPTIHGP